MGLRSAAVTGALVGFGLWLPAAPARARTYVDAAPESKPLIGVAFSTATLGDGDAALGGAGVELETGWAWEHGLSLVATIGETRHARGDALTARLGLQGARASDDALGLRARWALGRGELVPFAQVGLAADRVRFAGSRDGSALGASASLGGGLQLRAAPWEFALALEARRTWLEAPAADLPAVEVTRAVATLGVRLDW
jgi:hypothetical protein